MKKVFTIAVSMLMCAFVAGAAQANDNNTVTTQQETKTSSKTTVQEGTIIVNSFTKNWELGVSVGTQAYLGEYSGSTFKFGDWWTPTLDISIQKWTTPFFALGFGLNFSGYHGLYSSNDVKAVFKKDTDPLYRDYKNMYYAKGAYFNPYFKGSLDFCNLIGGYKSDRMFHLIGFIGGGVMLPMSKVQYYSVGATFNAGAVFQFNINKQWNIHADVRGGVVSDSFNGISYDSSGDRTNIPLDAFMGITVGASYKFGFVSKKHANDKTSYVSGKDVDAAEWIPMETAMVQTETYRKDVAAAREESANEVHKLLEAEKNVTAAQKEEIATLKKEVAASSQNTEMAIKNYKQYVNFRIDRYSISNRERVTVKLAADIINANPNTKFAVQGFADKQTATASYNKALSEKRAKAVADCLVKEFGVNPDQLVVSFEGGVDYMFFKKNYLSRAVLISVVEE